MSVGIVVLVVGLLRRVARSVAAEEPCAVGRVAIGPHVDLAHESIELEVERFAHVEHAVLVARLELLRVQDLRGLGCTEAERNGTSLAVCACFNSPYHFSAVFCGL